MATVQSMLPAALASVAEELKPRDELLTAEELQSLSVFEALKKAPSFARFPGTTVLRRCDPGCVICSQGDAGATAFYILTTEDVLTLRETQWASLQATLEAKAAGREADAPQWLFGRLSDRELKALEGELREEIDRLRRRRDEIQQCDEQRAEALRRVAAAHLLVDLRDDRPRRGLLHRFVEMFRRPTSRSGRPGDRSAQPAYIPIDGPADIDAQTLRAPLHEGELFGEMSCMNRAPRSATVIAEQECYLLEMLRNVLDMLHSDPVYKQRMDDTYRRRVLEGHVRALPVFQDLTDEEFAELQGIIELVEYPAGTVIFEEHEPSDAFYVIRGGLIKVVGNCWCSLRGAEFTDEHWTALSEEFTDVADVNAPLRALVWKRLPDDLRSAIEQADETALSQGDKTRLLAVLNDLIGKGDVHKQLGKTRQQVADAVNCLELHAVMEGFAQDTKLWSELDVRTFHRLFLEHVFPTGIPKRMASAGPARTLAYLGRGDFFGEIGVFLDQPRSATCVAYDHPVSGEHMRIPDSRTGAVPSRVELVRIGKTEFQTLLKSFPTIRRRVEQVVEQRRIKIAQERGEEANRLPTAAAQSPDFEHLGLIQGRKLMLIDLDRCTRCGACVDACVFAHTDGRTRLYLDGPRFEKYLIPLTCRQCLDPVCMIGCPVGSINRGENGEIQIRNWCIGCKVCAEQCPYGAIQMNELREPIELTEADKAVLSPGAELKAVKERAVVCDLCSSLPSQDPACVYACPHDAALRINAQDFFFETVGSSSRG